MKKLERPMNLIKTLLMGLLLVSCSYQPDNPHRGNIDNPLVRKVAWYSYLNGTDIRDRCMKGMRDEYRIIYNGQYEKQLRSYEISVGENGAGHFIARTASDQNAFNLTIGSPEDLFGPWRWQKSEMELNANDMASFRQLLEASDFKTGVKPGTLLHSRDFYWIAVGCENNNVFFKSWIDAKGEFTYIKFKDFLLQHDKTGLAFREPFPVHDQQRRARINRNNDNVEPIFTLTLEENGISGITNF